ncbi:hypothetical protein [Pseudoneobacillus sp. C159]
MKSSNRWLFFTLFSSLVSYYLSSISLLTIGTFLTGFIFSIAYLYKENLA